MYFSDIVRQAVSLSIKRQLPFAAFAYPHDSAVTFFADVDACGRPTSDRRFVVSSWCGGTNDEYVIHDRLDAKDLIADNCMYDLATVNPESKVWTFTTEKHTYDESVDLAIEHLQNHGGKTVISRTICGDGGHTDWLEVAERYFSLHDEAFRYIYFTPRHGFWLGASPELLLKVAGNDFMTMALAGTRNKSARGEAWSAKNIVEQAIVRDYIVDKLYDIGLEPVCEPTETVTTGNIQHLLTVIKGNVSGCSPRDILRALNPTPALAGYPLQSALEQIVALEKHPRRCYGGYVAVESDDGIDAYVNLRNVNFDEENWCMYVGSGIMPDSEIDDEWNETEAKSLILKQLIEDSRK